jgi:hypothetical protein
MAWIEQRRRSDGASRHGCTGGPAAPRGLSPVTLPALVGDVQRRLGRPEPGASRRLQADGRRRRPALAPWVDEG